VLTNTLRQYQGEIKKYVDEGRLSASEKEELLKQLDSNLAATVEEITKANAEGKPKKVEKLEEKRQGIVTRKEAVSKIQPIQHRLKHGDEVQKLRVKLFPLLALEDKGRSMSLTLQDLKTLEEKSDIEASIAGLEAASRGWFEEDDDFQARCALEAKEAKAKYSAKVKAAGAKKGGGGSGLSGKSGTAGKSGASSAGGWSTVGIAKKSGSSGGGAKKPAAGGFAAAFGNDSDSD
jgi:molybdopterin converting factor small subunit